MRTQPVDGIAGADLTLFKYSKIESRPPRLQEAVVKAIGVHLDGELVARHARLADFEDRCVDAEPVTDVNLVIEHPVNGEVLPKLTESKVRPTELGPPVGVVLEGIHQHRSHLAAMSNEVGLAIPVDIERRDLDAPIDRLLENAGANGLAFDRDLAWEGHTDGEELHEDDIFASYTRCSVSSSVGAHPASSEE